MKQEKTSDAGRLIVLARDGEDRIQLFCDISSRAALT
jgi:hypothetical protein